MDIHAGMIAGLSMNSARKTRPSVMSEGGKIHAVVNFNASFEHTVENSL